VNVTGRPPTGDSVNNSTRKNVTALKPNIEISKTAIPDSGSNLTQINFTIRVTNTGNVTLDPVEAKDTLPQGLTYVSDNRSGSNSGKAVGWNNLGPLAPGESRFIQLLAYFDDSVLGKLTNLVNVTGKPPSGTSVINSTTANVTAFRPNIEVTKYAISYAELPPTDITYIIRIINSGDVPLNPVWANDTLLQGLNYISDNQSGIASGNSIAWNNLGSLAPGESKSISVVAHVDGGVWDVENQVNVTGKPPIGKNVTNSTAVRHGWEPRVISGRKFNDLNGNGSSDGDTDPGIPGWTIELVNQTTGQVVRSITTNESGFYRMDNVTRGSYIVREVPQPDWQQTCPAQGNYSITVDHADWNKMDFGNQMKGATLGDFVWLDVNQDGVQEPNEPGVNGVAINLYRSDGTYVDTTKTNSTGLYRFTGLRPGSYFLEFKEPVDFVFCPCNQGSDKELDCDACIQGKTKIFTLVAGETDLSWDAGLLDPFINVTKVAYPTSASPGANISFEIKITNTGETALILLGAVDTLPTGMSYVSDNLSGSVSGRIITWNSLVDLAPGDSIPIHLVGRIDPNVSGILTNVVDAVATDSAGRELRASAKATVRSLLPKIKVEKTLEPVQYEQYCESKTIRGKGTIDSRTSIVDKKIALDYHDTLAGEGEIELESDQAMSEAAGKLQRDVPSMDGKNKSSLNFFEQTKLGFNGSKPLTGGKSVQSTAFYGGSGAEVQEKFSAEKMEKSQTVFFGSTDKATSPYTVGMDLSSSFKGSMETDSKMRKMFSEDIKSRQLFSGKFNLEKIIKFHENATEAQPKIGCGIDC
jgi:uncharacterized repeat protein (TIGR01451 family)